MESKLRKLVELIVNKRLKEYKDESKRTSMKESGRTMGTEAMREIVDDFIMETEMLIDEKYGNIQINDFKKMWEKVVVKFENKFRNILKNTSRP